MRASVGSLSFAYNPAVSILMFGAMETTTSALARILHTLAMHQDAQEKLRIEISKNVSSEHVEELRLPYDQIMDLPFLDAVYRETMRL